MREDHDDVLAELYRSTGVPADRLPHSPEFERLRQRFKWRTGSNLNSREIWIRLLRLRKDGRLPRLRR